MSILEDEPPKKKRKSKVIKQTTEGYTELISWALQGKGDEKEKVKVCLPVSQSARCTATNNHLVYQRKAESKADTSNGNVSKQRVSC